MSDKNILQELSKPFLDNEIEWRAQSFAENNGQIRALMLPYIDSRAAMQRLDDVLGVQWKDDYEKMEINGQQAFQCSISIYSEGQWITRTDGAECTDIESVKGGYSAAFKRAAVKFGIGRYLYDLKAQWCNVEEQRGGIFVKGKVNGLVIQGYVRPPLISQLMNKSSNVPAQTQSNNQTPQNNQQHKAPQNTQQDNPQAQAAKILTDLIAKLQLGTNTIPYLLERAGSKAQVFESASGEENKNVYHALTAVDKYLEICRANKLTLEQVIYYAQIVCKKSFNSIIEMVYEINYDLVNQAVELIKADFQQGATA